MNTLKSNQQRKYTHRLEFAGQFIEQEGDLGVYNAPECMYDHETGLFSVF
jgi:hypothetical protein